jgi:hypothetical protein
MISKAPPKSQMDGQVQVFCLRITSYNNVDLNASIDDPSETAEPRQLVVTQYCFTINRRMAAFIYLSLIAILLATMGSAELLIKLFEHSIF